ncbi:methyltransferase family protein [Acetobacter aceti NBRC 14818]|uniref:O-methyltransferase n=1 Tax=Acetobacter aceti NBRC 14818 TaxID=887700 RepID=A0AB33IHN6_ACEAC|nr:class I SAM-dependent methyltransferase [Acetobacter aceti]TCS32961.1 methyltransferase family protein [Acetobacter aceti NBRC 14818]BCK76389.1 hypothetical protein EMQ_1995 [Acetobacter aceti NBRC 14818]GAN56131.1 hypothetical protein Abac_003_030 [Acetobacter aceti NBRC 14818]
MAENYVYSNDWFVSNEPVWNQIITNLKPEKILEIGSYEGRSTCFAIDCASQHKDIEVYCVDTWEGGVEHKNQNINMTSVEERFDSNVNISIKKSKNKVSMHKSKGTSDFLLAHLITSVGKNYFDMIYVDGSHQAHDVLMDAVMSFKLLKPGGVLIFDDYLWRESVNEEANPLKTPKIAIDAFLNIFSQKMHILQAPLAQIYTVKISD